MQSVIAFTIFCTSFTSLKRPLSTVKAFNFLALATQNNQHHLISPPPCVGKKKNSQLAPSYRTAVRPSYLLIRLFSACTRTGSCLSSRYPRIRESRYCA